jgi:hypothetical protein
VTQGGREGGSERAGERGREEGREGGREGGREAGKREGEREGERESGVRGVWCVVCGVWWWRVCARAHVCVNVCACSHGVYSVRCLSCAVCVVWKDMRGWCGVCARARARAVCARPHGNGTCRRRW